MLLTLDDKDPRPLYEQVVVQIKAAVAEGRLSPGESLPGVRELADLLGVNLHTVHKAYQRLRDEGVIELRLGRRTRVAARATRTGKGPAEDKFVRGLEEIVNDAAVRGMTAREIRAMVNQVIAGKLGGRKT